MTGAEVTLPDMYTSGCSYRQLDHWTRLGHLRAADAAPGTGHRRRWVAGEDRIARTMRRLTDAGLAVVPAERVARAGGRLELAPGIVVTVDARADPPADVGRLRERLAAILTPERLADILVDASHSKASQQPELVALPAGDVAPAGADQAEPASPAGDLDIDQTDSSAARKFCPDHFRAMRPTDVPGHWLCPAPHCLHHFYQPDADNSP